MARAHGRDLRAALAGAIIIFWAVVEGVAVAQQGAEVTEDLGNSYLLARRTTSQGSVIETLLFDGQAVVTEIAVPAPDAGLTAGARPVVARTPAGSAMPLPAGAGAFPPGFGAGFGGTWLTGEIIEDYLVLHRIRATDPVTHEIFHEGRKVGSVTEVGPASRAGGSAGRNSFAFESTDDRFVVYLMQPDGARIRAITEHGRFLDQVVERSATLAPPPRFGVGVAAPLEPSVEPIGPSVGRPGGPQRLARPQEATGSIMVEEPAPPVIVKPPEAVPLPRPFPLPRTRPAAGATPVRTASPSPAGNSYRNAPERIIVAPTVRPDPATTSENARPPAAAPRPAAPASIIAAPAAGPKPAVPSVNRPPPPVARAVAPANTAPGAGPKPAVAAVAARPPAATPAKPIARESAIAAPAAKPKPALATGDTRFPRGRTSKPVMPAARPSRSPPSDESLR